MWLLYNKYFRFCLLFVVIFIFVFYQMSREQKEFILEKQNINSSIKNLVIISATYYEHSKMYPPNTIVLLINALLEKPLLLPSGLLARTEGLSSNLSVNFAMEPVAPINYACLWTSYLAVVESVPEPSRLKLSDSINSSGVEIPLRRPYSGRDVYVGTCYSPLFYMEHWQMLLISIEMHRYFGANLLVFYLQSALAEIFDLLKIYASIVELEPWYSIQMPEPDMKQTIGYDVNSELDWRNQAAAHTDCLIKYRNVANFLIIGDLDDLLIPQVGQNYQDELQIFDKRYPSAAIFSYTRFETSIWTEVNPTDFKFHGTLSSARVDIFHPSDPKYVANTSRVGSGWLHYSLIVKPNTTHEAIPTNQGLMLHFRKWNFTGNNGTQPLETVQKKSIWDPIPIFDLMLNSTILDQINQTFWATWEPHKAILHSLPKRQHYFKEISLCYKKTAENIAKNVAEGKKVEACPGPIRCGIEAIAGLKCSNGKRNFNVSRLESGINLIISHEEGHFEISQNGCTL